MKRLFTIIATVLWSCCMYAQRDSVTWDADFVENVVAWRNGDGTIEHADNSMAGITVTFDGPGKYCGFATGDIYLYKADALLTFTSTVGNISHIDIMGVTHVVDVVFPAGWTWVSSERIDPMYVRGTLSWDGTPAAWVVMNGSDETIYIMDISQIVFTISDTPAAIDKTEHVETTTPCRKYMQNGLLLIERNGKTYNALGVEW